VIAGDGQDWAVAADEGFGTGQRLHLMPLHVELQVVHPGIGQAVVQTQDLDVAVAFSAQGAGFAVTAGKGQAGIHRGDPAGQAGDWSTQAPGPFGEEREVCRVGLEGPGLPQVR
jgi:hypothetical protein